MKLGIREIVLLVVLTAIPLGTWWFVFRPNNARNAKMMAEIKSRQKKLQQLNKATATIGNLKIEIASINEAIQFFRSKLPSEKEIDKVLREVWRLAEANQLTTKSIRPIKPTEAKLLTDPNGPYAEQPILMKLEGSFAGFYGFLLALETQPRIMRMREMKIKKAPKGQRGRVEAECEVSIFFERAGRES